ncbi:HipA domain-containing protein [Neobacillus sp. Marseille-QA0830]
MVEGADMIMDFDQTYNRDILQGEKEIYNFDLLYRLFSKYCIIDELFKMIIFDTLIGNTDRHQDNFGVIRNEKTGEHKFAPLYDNSSSLGREFPTQKVKLMLRDPNMFSSYIYGSKSTTLLRWGQIWHKKRMNIFVFYDLVTEKHPEIKDYIPQIESLTNQEILNIINNIPQVVMSDSHKELVYKILITRRDRILSEGN